MEEQFGASSVLVSHVISPSISHNNLSCYPFICNRLNVRQVRASLDLLQAPLEYPVSHLRKAKESSRRRDLIALELYQKLSMLASKCIDIIVER